MSETKEAAPSRLHADRIARGHCDHRRADCIAVASRATGEGGRTTDTVPEQPQADGTRTAQLSFNAQQVSTGTPAPRSRQRDHRCGECLLHQLHAGQYNAQCGNAVGSHDAVAVHGSGKYLQLNKIQWQTLAANDECSGSTAQYELHGVCECGWGLSLSFGHQLPTNHYREQLRL